MKHSIRFEKLKMIILPFLLHLHRWVSGQWWCHAMSRTKSQFREVNPEFKLGKC